MLTATPIEDATSYTFLLLPSRGTPIKVTSSYPTVSMNGLLPDTSYVTTVTAITSKKRFVSAPQELRTPALR